MSFDLPALLSEYLLPLLLLVPLAIVVLLIAARSNKDDHWSHSPNDLLGPGTARTSLPTVRPDLPRTPTPSARDSGRRRPTLAMSPDATARTKKGKPAQSTTGVPSSSCIQFDICWPST